MMINFCHHSVKPLIKSDKLSFDGYEVTNLISSDSESKRRGFLSDHFMKPPFNITIQFPCNIEIYRIIINPVVGQQKSCDIKIFTASQTLNNSWLFGNNDTRLAADGVLFNVAGYVSQREPTTVCFENQFFKNRGCVQKDETQFPCMAYLNARKSGGLTNVSHVTICIQKTKDSKAGAIRSLEVWGIASSKVPYKVHQILWKTYNAGIALDQRNYQKLSVTEANKPSGDETGLLKSTGKSDKLSNDTSIRLDGIEIPEDFIDPITFEIMALPVLLPSGKCIDQTTLDKFVNAEASWGRSPSDPFTGLAFVGDSKPETNVPLKARIDQFVLSHSETLTNVPRTLGTDKRHLSNGSNFPLKTSRLLAPQGHSQSVSKYPVTNNIACPVQRDSTLNRNRTNIVETLSGTGRTFSDLPNVDSMSKLSTLKSSTSSGTDVIDNTHTNRRAAKRKSDTVTSLNQFSKLMKTSCSDNVRGGAMSELAKSVHLDSSKSSALTGRKTTHTVDIHKSDLAQSLDSALFSALSGLPTFSKPARKSVNIGAIVSEENKSLCFKCCTQLAGGDTIKYKLPCEHLVCRKCLQAIKGDILCLKCNKSSKSNEVVRIF